MLSIYCDRQAMACLFFTSLIFFISLQCQAEMQPLTDTELSKTHAQASIELDLEVQASIDSIIYEDADGLSQNGEAGVPGVLGLRGVHLGSSKSPITAEQMSADKPFSDSDLALIQDLIIDVDNQEGLRINLARLGDRHGNGLDIIVQNILLGNENTSAGKLLIEDLSNFISDAQLARLNHLFGTQLTTNDDGLNTRNGNFIPFQAQIITEQNAFNISEPDVVSGSNIFPDFLNATDMTVNAAFAVGLKKAAWVDDGGEFGVAGLMIYQGIDTNNDGIDDQVGLARLDNLKMKTVEHISSITGESVQAMHFSNLNFQADIAIESIYVGQPENSFGSLLIKGLDTTGTQVWMYSH